MPGAAISDPFTPFSQNLMAENYVSQYIAQSANNFLFECREKDSLDASFGFFNHNWSIKGYHCQ